ncbi:nuclear transport factor 2 family protein [Nocardioides sp. KR10-350]|uniref:nuclear transport factor 2 family protein n=1 Tax=Nocardioides cheoyonin TaxID=3156615 RepID=UPI0032B5BDC3
MSDLRDRYLDCWNATDPEVRADLIVRTWAPDATYVDPLVDVAGFDALTATIGAVHEQFPGFVFTPVGEVDAHHGVARFGWGLGPEGGEPLVVGFDVVSTDGEGRISSVVGFLDKVPA